MRAGLIHARCGVSRNKWRTLKIVLTESHFPDLVFRITFSVHENYNIDTRAYAKSKIYIIDFWGYLGQYSTSQNTAFSQMAKSWCRPDDMWRFSFYGDYNKIVDWLDHL